MAKSRSLGKLVRSATQSQPLNKVFIRDLMSVIEVVDQENSRKPSRWYKPSSLVCLRQMFFQRVGQPIDDTRTEYTMVGMADTGTRRHEAIQEALIVMKDKGYDWEYIDVEKYVLDQKANGKCTHLEVKGKRGAETHLFHKTLLLSFMCDGIIQQRSSGRYFLFEFKNQASPKYHNHDTIDPDHINQVTCYALCLELDDALVVYENRDFCTLECHEVYHVTSRMKQSIVNHILECESYVERSIPPPKHEDKKNCRYCRYESSCRRAG